MSLGALVIQQKGEGSYGTSYVSFCFVSFKKKKVENLGMMVYALNTSTQEAEVGLKFLSRPGLYKAHHHRQGQIPAITTTATTSQPKTVERKVWKK